MTRRVKLIGEFYTLDSVVRATLEDGTLCDRCGAIDCVVASIMTKLDKNIVRAKLDVTRCESFIPIIEFQDAAGMADKFNTFRLGSAWASRVAIGRKVALRTSREKALITFARVTAVDNGPFHAMNKKHGISNHMAIDAEVRGVDYDMGKIMAACYGGHRFNADTSLVSVITLERIDGTS